jgi:plasmid maintenance system antidote protein VapI
LWLKLQNFYDLEGERRLGKALETERQARPVGAE